MVEFRHDTSPGKYEDIIKKEIQIKLLEVFISARW